MENDISGQLPNLYDEMSDEKPSVLGESLKSITIILTVLFFIGFLGSFLADFFDSISIDSSMKFTLGILFGFGMLIMMVKQGFYVSFTILVNSVAGSFIGSILGYAFSLFNVDYLGAFIQSGYIIGGLIGAMAGYISHKI